MKFILKQQLFKNTEYYKNNNSFGNFILDSFIMKNIKIPRTINRDLALDELSIINNIFMKYNIYLFLTHGSCLGAIREKNFIKYDSDIDIGCYKKDIEKIIDAIIELRDIYHFKITKLSLDDESIAIIRNNVIIDISLYKKDKLYWKANRHKIFEIPYKFLDNLYEIDFLGIKINVPCCVEEYLEYQYGKDWKIPIKDFYSPYRQKVELPIFNFSKYFIGKKLAKKLAKFISNIAKKIRKNYA